MKGKFGRFVQSPSLWIPVLLVVIALLTTAGPAEKTLGPRVRVVYLHGAWVWTALSCFIASGIVGSAALLTRRTGLHTWSSSLGRTGLLFWVSYLPISIWAMQSNWNGLFLAEPRWRLAVIFAVAGLLLQSGLTLINRPKWTSVFNIGFVASLLLSIAGTREVMHPPSPILTSDSRQIQAYFAALVTVSLLAAWQITRILRRFEPSADSYFPPTIPISTNPPISGIIQSDEK